MWELMASCMSLSASERLLHVSSSRGTDETKADKQLSNARATVGTRLVVSVVSHLVHSCAKWGTRDKLPLRQSHSHG